VSVAVVLVFWKCVHARAHLLEYCALVPLLGVIWLTGSRTGLVALLMALVLILVLAPRVPALIAATTVAAVPVVLAVTFFTPLVSRYAGRGEDLASVSTLNQRTVAWRAALNYADTDAERWFGSGLALKQIPVTAMYRSEQILDSSWVSALIQAGYLGSVMFALFVLETLVQALRLAAPQRSLVFPLVAIVAAVGVLESGLFDTTPAFILFFTMSVLAHRVRTTASAPPVAAAELQPSQT